MDMHGKKSLPFFTCYPLSNSGTFLSLTHLFPIPSLLLLQVHFSEQQSQYVKLEVTVPQGPSLQCMEGYSTTPTTGFKQFHFLKPCQVSGLLLLEKGAELKAVTGSYFTLQDSGKHYFGLFKVN